jgi:Uncharacterized alpha/beta hydrolase domain (DUF2235)
MGNPFGSSGDDKKKPDGVTTYPADAHDIQSYADASKQLSELKAPVLINKANPHERLFVAAFDGTGNSMLKDPEHLTNVAQMTQQIQAANKIGQTNIQVGYVEGPGTQGGLSGTYDAAKGYTYDQRLEQMYVQFTQQAVKWLKEDPNAQIRVADIGFSRGAEQAAGFARLVEERGIQDPSGARVERNLLGQTHTEYTKPPLVAPGQVTQAVGLFDPVGTGTPRDHDRRLPPSVISGFQVTAEDERRNLFKSTNIIDPGFHENNRFLNVTVGGAHSDIGGSYQLNGLSTRSGNLMTDYLNSLSDTPFLKKQAVPTAPEMNVVHRSEEHQFFYRTSEFDKNGGRVRIEEVAPKSVARTGADVTNKEPRNEAMAQNFVERPVPTTPDPVQASVSKEHSFLQNPEDKHLHLKSSDAVKRLDAELGRTPDAASDRMAASLTVLAKSNDMQIDRAVLSIDNGRVKAGENVMIVEGSDAARKIASMPTAVAVATRVEDSFKQLNDLSDRQKQTIKPDQPAIAPEQPEPKALSR